jgi:hypothetical protein
MMDLPRLISTQKVQACYQLSHTVRRPSMAASSRSTLATLAMGITDQRHWRIIQLFALAGPLIGSATWAISELPGAQASGEILDSLKSLPLLVLTSLPAAYMMGFVPALCTGILAAIIWAHMGVSPWLRKAGHRRLGPCRFFLRDLPIQQSRAIRYRVRMCPSPHPPLAQHLRTYRRRRAWQLPARVRLALLHPGGPAGVRR